MAGAAEGGEHLGGGEEGGDGGAWRAKCVCVACEGSKGRVMSMIYDLLAYCSLRLHFVFFDFWH